MPLRLTKCAHQKIALLIPFTLMLAACSTPPAPITRGEAQSAPISTSELAQSDSNRLATLSMRDNRASLMLLADKLYRRIMVRGRWLASSTVFLDNRQMHGKPGFFAVTPLQLEGSAQVVLVQRGWVPRNFIDRSQVPALPLEAGLVQLEGRIAPPPSKLYDFDASQAGVIRQNLDLVRFSREIGRPLLDVSILQSGPPGDGLLRDWPRVNVGVEKHHGYAFQWFALGGLITLLYGWFQIVRRFISPR